MPLHLSMSIISLLILGILGYSFFLPIILILFGFSRLRRGGSFMGSFFNLKGVFEQVLKDFQSRSYDSSKYNSNNYSSASGQTRSSRTSSGGSSAPPMPDSSIRQKALMVLGIKKLHPTDKEVSDSYIRLMKLNHPDKGGSAYLAQQINEARDILLKK